MGSLRDTTQHHQGRLYTTCRSFVTEKECNDFLHKNAGYGLLYTWPIRTVAKTSDKGEPYKSPLNKWKANAQGWNDDSIHQGELSLYFTDKAAFNDTIKRLMESTLAPRIRAFVSPIDAPQQLTYSIFIERPASDYFTQKPLALAAHKALTAAGIECLEAGCYGPGMVTVTTRKSWTLAAVSERLAPHGVRVQEHPLTNLATNKFRVGV